MRPLNFGKFQVPQLANLPQSSSRKLDRHCGTHRLRSEWGISRGSEVPADVRPDQEGSLGDEEAYLHIRLVAVRQPLECFHVHFIMLRRHAGGETLKVTELEVGSQIWISEGRILVR